MWKRKLGALLLAAALLVTAAAPALAAAAPFPDIKDSATALEVDSLRMLGAISGDNYGKFDPDGKLTRAAFAKIAVIVLGKGDLEPTYRNRTIFPDVRSTHWARGYVNLAASGELSIIKGTAGPGGPFKPDDTITYGQAVTMVTRMLGYTDADTGLVWPDGYLELAGQIGLTDGLDLSPNAAINRAQAVHLFCNLLNTPKKEGGLFSSTLGTVTPNVVILALDVTAEDGTAGAVRTSEGVLKVKSGVSPQSLLGQKGSLIVNDKGEIITLVPDGGENRTITVTAAAAGRLTDSTGAKYTIPTEAVTYTSEGSTTYDKAWVDIAPGDRVTLYFTAGKVTALYLNTAPAADAVVVTGSASAATFRTITGGATGYPIYKNGQSITYADIQPYDVATFAAGALNISSLRLTGAYENVAPNTEYPTSVTVMGHDFPVLSSAVDSLSGLKLGETITLLLTADGQVAGAYRPSAVQGNAMGIVKSAGNDTAEVELLGTRIILKGKPFGSAVGGSLVGQLVSVSSYEKGRLRLEKLPSGTSAGAFQVSAMKLGTYTVSPGVILGERVGSGPVKPLTLDSLGRDTIPAGQISYYHLNAAKQVDVLIFNDATGDCYTYGILKSEVETVYDSGFEYTQRTMRVTNQSGEHGPYKGGGSVSGGRNVFGGVAEGANGTVANWLTLTALQGVPRSAFATIDGTVWLTHNGQSFPVSEEVQCYNSVSGTWFADLAACRAFSNNLTVYYDRSPDEGGKIRVVVAN